MLTIRPKISELTFRVFGRSLHPELFRIYASRTIVRKHYELRVNITNAGHLLTWSRQGDVLSEVACSQWQPLPAQRQLFSQVVRAPQQKRIAFADVLDYRSRFQIDPADPKTFAMIQRELLKSAPCEGLAFQFESSGRLEFGAISYVNVVSRQNSVFVQAFHTFPETYFVFKSESVFELQPLI